MSVYMTEGHKQPPRTSVLYHGDLGDQQAGESGLTIDPGGTEWFNPFLLTRNKLPEAMAYRLHCTRLYWTGWALTCTIVHNEYNSAQ